MESTFRKQRSYLLYHWFDRRCRDAVIIMQVAEIFQEGKVATRWKDLLFKGSHAQKEFTDLAADVTQKME